jgi:predicted peptidase
MKNMKCLFLLATAAGIFFSSCQKITDVLPGPKRGDTTTTTNITPANTTTNSNDYVVESTPAVMKAITTTFTENIGGMYAATPALYESTTKKYPLLIFIHGVGELGNGTSDLPRILSNGVPRLLNEKTFPANFTVNGGNYSFIVATPQFKTWPKPNEINDLINYMVASYRIDEKRIYVSGLSMGGGATWDFSVDNAARIAAITPICGAAWFGEEYCAKIAAANLPVWAFHNADDYTVGAGSTVRLIDMMNKYNPNPQAKSTIWPTGGHDAWTKATNPETRECEGKNMYEWMLQYTR